MRYISGTLVSLAPWPWPGLMKSRPLCHRKGMARPGSSPPLMTWSMSSGALDSSSGASGCPQPAIARRVVAASSNTTQHDESLIHSTRLGP